MARAKTFYAVSWPSQTGHANIWEDLFPSVEEAMDLVATVSKGYRGEYDPDRWVHTEWANVWEYTGSEGNTYTIQRVLFKGGKS